MMSPDLKQRLLGVTPVVLFLAVSLAHVADPPLGRDAWRETDVLMVGRNFCREQTPLWLPRIDARGDGPGITGMEFPLLNELHGVAACHGLDQVVSARLLSLLFTLLGALAFHSLTRRALSGPLATVSLVLFLFSPLLVHYGHAIQPDVPALALGLVGLWWLRLHVERESISFLVLSGIALCAGILVKLPIVVFGLPALLTLWEHHGPRTLWTPRYLAYAAGVLAPVLAWYRHARALQEQYGLNYFYLGKSFGELVADWTSAAFYRDVLGKLLDVYTLPVFALVAGGVVLWRWGAIPLWLRGLAVASLAYVFLAGHHIAVHYYYGVPVVPILAFGGGVAIGELRRWLSPDRMQRAVVAFVVLTMVHGVWRSHGWSPRRKVAQEVIVATGRAQKELEPDGRLLLVSDMDPTILWFLDRKGWVINARSAATFLDRRRPTAVAIDTRRIGGGPLEALGDVLRTHGYEPVSAGRRVSLWSRKRDSGG